MPRADEEGGTRDLESLRFVGPKTAAVLRDADITVDDVAEKRVSHAQLVDVGVHPGVAAKIRREHSLSWSFSGGEDLDRRAEQVRGLKDDEREWVAASYDEWEDEDAASADGSGDTQAAEAAWRSSPWPGQTEADRERVDEVAEEAWRQESAPTPVTDVAGIDEDTQRRLAEAGVTSVRRLATCNAERVADALGVSVDQVREWRDAARAREQ